MPRRARWPRTSNAGSLTSRSAPGASRGRSGHGGGPGGTVIRSPSPSSFSSSWPSSSSPPGGTCTSARIRRSRLARPIMRQPWPRWPTARPTRNGITRFSTGFGPTEAGSAGHGPGSRTSGGLRNSTRPPGIPSELRNEAADCLMAVDVRRSTVLGERFDVGRLAFSPDGKAIALAEKRGKRPSFFRDVSA